MGSKAKGIFFLFFIYCCIAAAISLRIHVESTQYTTPDSHFYLYAAKNMLSGNGLKTPYLIDYPFKNESREFYFGFWPAGYPVCISAISLMTGYSPLISSKIVNLLFLGLIFVLLYFWCGTNAWLPALYFMSYSMLQVYSYTWSEGPFLFFLLWLCYLLTSKSCNSISLIFQVFFCLSCLFLFRYVGFLFYVFLIIYILWSFYKKKKLFGIYLSMGFLLATVFALTYLKLNKIYSGFYFGYDRFEIKNYPPIDMVLNISKGILNEFFIMKNYFFKGNEPVMFFMILLFLQIFFIILLIYKRRNLKSPVNLMTYQYVLFFSGTTYLAGIILLKMLTQFDDFNYRLLAPFSLPIYMSFLISLTDKYHQLYLDRVRFYIIGFMFLSLIMNLPKAYIITKLSTFFSSIS